jgi:hypothetical protein
MEENLKQLLLKDLSARLPYGVILHIEDDSGNIIDEELNSIDLQFNEINVEYHLFTDVIQPYLRSISSMTEEELKELNEKFGNIAYFFIQKPPYYHGLQVQHSDIGLIEISEFSEVYDWLNAHHFDYRIVPSTGKTMIDSELALEALEGMYENL